jgi:hypothetical protein
MVAGAPLAFNSASVAARWKSTASRGTDKQWLRCHAFYITARGKLSARHNHCEPAYLATDGKS